MKNLSRQLPSYAQPNTDADLRLLEEVDFKWLMAGQGWWINAERLHSDQSYAAQCLALARDCELAPLRHCAALLQRQSAPSCA